MCGLGFVVGASMAALDSRAPAPTAERPRCFYPEEGRNRWCHVECFATTHAWRVRAGLEVADPPSHEAVLVARSRTLCVGPAFWRPSQEQLALYRWVARGRGSAVLEARAGSAKTSTLAPALSLAGAVRVCWARSYAALYAAPLVLAFNRHNQEDLVRVLRV
jgi:hypothetical protein